MSTNHEAFTFALDLPPDDGAPAAGAGGPSTMRLDFAPTDPAAHVSRGPFALTIHTSAAQATVRHSARGRIHHDDLVLLMAVARCAYAEGRAAAGGDPSEVMLTAPEAGTLPAGIGGRWMGAPAWLHYTDDAGELQCGAHVERVRGFHGAANIVAAIIEGAVVCPRCAEMHRLEAAAVKTGAQHVDG